MSPSKKENVKLNFNQYNINLIQIKNNKENESVNNNLNNLIFYSCCFLKLDTTLTQGYFLPSSYLVRAPKLNCEKKQGRLMLKAAIIIKQKAKVFNDCVKRKHKILLNCFNIK